MSPSNEQTAGIQAQGSVPLGLLPSAVEQLIYSSIGAKDHQLLLKPHAGGGMLS
jgi:hypothetical protein